MGRLRVLEASLAKCNGSGLDSIDDSRALRRDLDVSLLPGYEYPQGYNDGAGKPDQQ
jgi:hypothetical protein